MSCPSAAKLVQSSATITSLRATNVRRPIGEEECATSTAASRNRFHLFHSHDLVNVPMAGGQVVTPHRMDRQLTHSPARPRWHWHDSTPFGMQIARYKVVTKFRRPLSLEQSLRDVGGF